MTPEQAREIDFAARKVEADKHMANYQPVNQDAVILAGYRAVIDAVESECQVAFVTRYLQSSEIKVPNGG